MGLEKVATILRHATDNRYGVISVNTFNYETIKWAVAAAEQESSPIILQLYPGMESYIPLEYISYMAKDSASKASVPIGVHLDHSKSFEIAVSGIRAGFPSVMVDGSSMPYEENAALTAAVVKVARIFDVDVEAELGHVGFGSNPDNIINSDNYTDVDEAVDFVETTGCSSLAIAVGSAHGPYSLAPNLDFERIKTIREKLSIPLVLHGCSDIPDNQLREAVQRGMSKFNIATEYFSAFYDAIYEKTREENNGNGNAMRMFPYLEQPVCDFLRERIRVLNPDRITLS